MKADSVSSFPLRVRRLSCSCDLSVFTFPAVPLLAFRVGPYSWFLLPCSVVVARAPSFACEPMARLLIADDACSCSRFVVVFRDGRQCSALCYQRPRGAITPAAVLVATLLPAMHGVTRPHLYLLRFLLFPGLCCCLRWLCFRTPSITCKCSLGPITLRWCSR